MITALFGGSFDPVHKGHTKAAQAVLRAREDIERLIVMPAFVNPFKAGLSGGGRAEGRHRLEMCRIAFENIPKCIVSDYELSMGDVSYTVRTLRHLKETYPGDGLILVLGSDSLETLPGWHRAEEIISMAEIAAVSRSAEQTEKTELYARRIEELGGRVFIAQTEPFDISSTEIRKKILNNRDISCYTDKNVVKYIMNNNVYG